MEEITEESMDTGTHFFGAEAQVKTVIKRRQSEFNPMFTSPLHGDAIHANCMFILVHESQIKDGEPVFTTDTDELTEAQYASYLEFTKKYGRSHHLGNQPYYAENDDKPNDVGLDPP